MKRKAILIAGSPADDPLEGVYVDIPIWKSFLSSGIGGSWRQDEIVDATDFNRDKILKEVSNAKHSDYSLVVFTGHGQTVKTDLPWDQLEVFTSHGDTVLEKELNPGTPSCTLIFDCCRAAGQLRFLEAKTASLKLDIDPILCRVAYDKAINDAEKGLVSIYATALGTYADDKETFSQHLIYQALGWAEIAKGTLNLKDGVELAKKAMIPQQQPEYQGGRRLRHFPLAVKP